MFFNSLEFLVFLPVVYAVYRLLGLRGQNHLLLLASYVFYGAWDLRFLYLIALSTCVDFYCGWMMAHGSMEAGKRRAVGGWLVGAALGFVAIDWGPLFGDPVGAPRFEGPMGAYVLAASLALYAALELTHASCARLTEDRRRRLFVTISVVVNLGILGVAKYFDFFVASAEELARDLGADPHWLRLDLILPVGISFYTFQTMSYTLDIYRRQLKPTGSFVDFALFVSYFPQLVAGPIERARKLLPIITAPRRIRFEDTMRGLFLILFGMMKKVAIADGVAGVVDSVYQGGAGASWLEVVVATVLFAVQIYCDFSGYSDIARGTSKLFGIELMTNFRLPYFSANPREFWSRWHISLSTWLRDYLYISLGGNRGGPSRTHRNLMATMLLGGLWHGAAWNYVLWGAYQGALLVAHRLSFDRRRASEPAGGARAVLVKLVRASFFFPIVCYGWLLFRADSVAQIGDFTHTLIFDIGDLSVGGMAKPTFAAMAGMVLLAVCDLFQLGTDDARFYLRWHPALRGVLAAAMFFVVLMGTSNAPVQFIYFQF